MTDRGLADFALSHLETLAIRTKVEPLGISLVCASDIPRLKSSLAKLEKLGTHATARYWRVSGR